MRLSTMVLTDNNTRITKLIRMNTCKGVLPGCPSLADPPRLSKRAPEDKRRYCDETERVGDLASRGCEPPATLRRKKCPENSLEPHRGRMFYERGCQEQTAPDLAADSNSWQPAP